MIFAFVFAFDSDSREGVPRPSPERMRWIYMAMSVSSPSGSKDIRAKGQRQRRKWIPAFAGMTDNNAFARSRIGFYACPGFANRPYNPIASNLHFFNDPFFRRCRVVKTPTRPRLGLFVSDLIACCGMQIWNKIQKTIIGNLFDKLRESHDVQNKTNAFERATGGMGPPVSSPTSRFRVCHLTPAHREPALGAPR